ncbi:MAG: hypothetical protein K0B10_07295 [Vicingaceae bacterium]|nr:hypothetical protein [Vicingaceae bacterium]
MDSTLSWMTFGKTTAKETIKYFGKPTDIRETWSHANIGVCIFSYYTILTYDELGMELIFYSGRKRKRTQTLWQIKLLLGSSNYINSTIRTGTSTNLEILETFGIPEDISDDRTEFYYTAKDHIIQLFIDNKGILQEIEIR